MVALSGEHFVPPRGQAFATEVRAIKQAFRAGNCANRKWEAVQAEIGERKAEGDFHCGAFSLA